MYCPLFHIQHLIGMINQKNSNVVQKKLLVTKPGTVQYKIYFKIGHFLLYKLIMEVNIFYTITNNYNFVIFKSKITLKNSVYNPIFITVIYSFFSLDALCCFHHKNHVNFVRE